MFRIQLVLTINIHSYYACKERIVLRRAKGDHMMISPGASACTSVKSHCPL